MISIILIFFFAILDSSAQQDSNCNYFKYCSNGNQRSSSKSQPTTSNSANFNPSNISIVKGLGIETLFQPNNPLGYNIVTGNGKFGAALITPTSENSFFGNRSIELDPVYLQRRVNKKRYISKKINLALGANLISKKKFSLDLGISLKRNPEIKKINPGLGFSAILWIFNFGAYVYKDDTKVEFGNYVDPTTQILYSSTYGASSYAEAFTAKTLTIGLQLGNLSLDSGMIKAKYDFYAHETSINIYSAAYNYKKFLFNFAYRKELSDNMKEHKGVLTSHRMKENYYSGIQYLWNRHITSGIAYNNFLVNDISFTLTLFL